MKRTSGLANSDLTRLKVRTVLFCAVFLGVSWHINAKPTKVAMSEPELLEAEKAFSATARRSNEHSIELRYSIADGYYLYRDKFRFLIDGVEVSIARKAWPKGIQKDDANFGKVVVYRKSVRLLLPRAMKEASSVNGANKAITLTVMSQGCADAGVCYPPLRQTFVLVADSSTIVDPQVETPSGFFHRGGIDDNLKRSTVK